MQLVSRSSQQGQRQALVDAPDLLLLRVPGVCGGRRQSDRPSVDWMPVAQFFCAWN
jgi:hypothetical protein